MKVKGKNLWKHIGNTILITEEHASEYIPVDSYIIESNEDYGLILIKDSVDYVLEGYEEEDEFTVFIDNTEYNLEKIYQYRIKKILRLSNEGWALESELKDMNLEPELMKLKVAKEILNIINS